jgi:hypothetical protein
LKPLQLSFFPFFLFSPPLARDTIPLLFLTSEVHTYLLIFMRVR